MAFHAAIPAVMNPNLPDDRRIVLEPPAPETADRLPDLDELSTYLRFSPGSGHIWLDDRRMLLLHDKAYGALRRELIETVGIEKARGILTRIGYLSGMRDA